MSLYTTHTRPWARKLPDNKDKRIYPSRPVRAETANKGCYTGPPVYDRQARPPMTIPRVALANRSCVKPACRSREIPSRDNRD